VWTVGQLATLNEYALPIERVFLLLGLNCAYGADQAGRLRVSHLRLTEGGPGFIRRIRRKKKTRSIHLLWRQTADALRWALARRRRQGHESEFVLLTDTGRPYWSKTKGGNRSQLIPNLWGRLLGRVRKDYPDFPRLPFNSLRDTSADLIRRIGGEEIASLHLAHKHQSRDENLNRYTNPVRRRHFSALRKLERRLESVFAAAGADPWSERRRTTIGLAKVRALQGLHAQGVRVAEIARRLGVSSATVYRHLPGARPGAEGEGQGSTP
jgi:hypothetical protein